MLLYYCKYGDVAELVEGTSLLTRQGSNSLMGSNPIVSAKIKPRILGFILLKIHNNYLWGIKQSIYNK